MTFGSGAPETLVLGTPGNGLADPMQNLGDGDRIEFANGMTVTSAVVAGANSIIANIISGGVAGTYKVTNVGFAPGSSKVFSTGIDSSTGNSFIQMETSQRSDIWLQNANGQAAVFQVNGTTASPIKLVGSNPGTSLSLVGTGGFFPGDSADYLWRAANGSVVLWQVNNSNTIMSQSTLATNPGTSWYIKGTGDFYGNGHTDILWQTLSGAVVIWDMDGATISQSGTVSTVASTWHIEGTGDFNHDGKTDILWRNDNGAVTIWNMNGATISQFTPVTNPGTSWNIEGTGDFYGNGHTDILWRSDTGSVVIWEVNGAMSQSGTVAINPAASWHIDGTGDFNHDGKTDIVWRNDNGAIAVWNMNGTVIAASGVAANPGPSWNPTGMGTLRFIYPTSTNAPLAATPLMADQFVLNSLPPSGSQTITGFDPTLDIIEFSKAQFANFAAVQAATTASGGGSLIALSQSNSVLLPGVAPASLHVSNFAFA